MTKNSEPYSIESLIEGVTVLERKFTSKANRRQVTQRLYSCESGAQLGARRGGTADDKTWEIFTMYGGIVHGEPAYHVTNEVLERCVARLAAWGQEAA